MHACTHTHTHTHTHTRTHTCKHAHTHYQHLHTHTHTHARTHVHTQMHVHIIIIRTCKNTIMLTHTLKPLGQITWIAWAIGAQWAQNIKTVLCFVSTGNRPQSQQQAHQQGAKRQRQEDPSMTALQNIELHKHVATLEESLEQEREDKQNDRAKMGFLQDKVGYSSHMLFIARANHTRYIPSTGKDVAVLRACTYTYPKSTHIHRKRICLHTSTQSFSLS